MGRNVGRGTNRLSARAVTTAKEKGYYPDGGGLYLQVSAAGTKSWIFRYTLRGRAREMGLGALSVISLAEARERAQVCRRQLADGVDPIDARDDARAAAAHTFEACAAEYIKANEAGWKNAKHADQWRNTLATYAYPTIGAMPAAAITTAHVVKILEPIWKSKTETATRVRQRIEAVLDYAKVHKYRSGENPATWRGNLEKILPKPGKVAKVEHFAALPFAEVPAFVRRLQRIEAIGALMLEFTILCAARTTESRLAVPAEFDLAEKVWNIPGARMKSGRAHTVPLSDRAVEIVELAMRLNAPFVFSYRRRALSNGAMLALLDGMQYGHITVHGFRSSFRDWAAETTNHPSEVVEMALAHVIADKTEAAYRRGTLLQKRRALMDDWAAFVTSGEPNAAIDPLNPARARRQL